VLPEAPLHLEGCQVDLRRRLVARDDGTTASLTAREVELLAFFARHPDRTITREELLVEVWGYSPDMVTRTVDNTIRRLRTKIEENPREPRHVLTVFGEGYRFAPLAPARVALPQGRVALVRLRAQGLHDLAARDADLATRTRQVLHQVLEQTAEDVRGVVVRLEPDALVAFGEPHGALTFALQVQERLLDAPWPAQVLTDTICQVEPGRPGRWAGPRVAAAVAFGQGTPLGETYEGAVQDRVDGLLELAHGGQILVGPDLWRAASPLSELGAVGTPLGALELAPDTPPVAVGAVAPESLAERRFPPPRTTAARRTNLDVDVNSFVGRRQVLARLHGLFARGAHLVTVLGTAGAGKTRLVRRYGLSQVDELSADGGGVWFVDLSESTSPEEVVAATASALGVPLDPDRDVSEDRAQVGRALAARGRMLLILDNAEQVVDGLVPSVAAWREAAPRCRLLVTSRQVLDLPREQVLQLPPLDPGEALALFVDRARAVRLDLELEADDLSAIEHIAERLDHNPLALELAAVRVRVLPPRRLAERLDARFSTLGRGPRDGPARHATLDQAIAWSWGLLEPWGQAAFAQLGVFRGGFDLDASRAILRLPQGSPELPDVLEGLQDRSLVRRAEPVGLPGTVRLHLLLSLREWAAGRLAERDDADQVRDRHVRWATERGQELLSALDGEHGATAAQHLALERGNLLEAHRTALSSGDHDAACRLAVVLDAALAPRGPYEDHLHLLDDTVEHASSARAEHRVDLRLARSRAHAVRGDVARAEHDLAMAARLAQGDVPVQVRARAWLDCGRWSVSRGRTHEGRRLQSGARRAAESAGDAVLVARVDAAEARWHAAAGRLEQALELGRRTLSELHPHPARRLEASLQIDVASWASDRGQLEEARGLLREALGLARQLQDLRLEARILTRLGALYHDLGRLEVASEHLVLALEQQERVGDRRQAGICRGHLGVIEAERDRLDQALALLDGALSALEDAEDPRLEGWFLGWRAAVLTRQGRRDQALTATRRALERLDEADDPRLRGRIVARSVRLLLDLGQSREARSAVARARSLAEQVGDADGLAVAGFLAQRMAGSKGTLAEPRRLEARWVADRE